MRIPVANFRPVLAAAEPQWRANLETLFNSGPFVLGPQLARFETDFAAAIGANFVVGVGNGIDAIELALRDANIRGEVITSALAAPFTAAAIRAAGCKPRFADIDPCVLQVDVRDLARRVTERTRAIVAVHLYGQPCGLRLMDWISRNSDAVIIQDACQAHGARLGSTPLTARSPYVCYSFSPHSNLAAPGDGGAIATDNEETAWRLRSRRDGGRGESPRLAELWGVNSRLDEMHCCFLRAFLLHLDEWNEMRRRLADRYDELLRGCPGITLILRSPESVCRRYVIRAQQRLQLRAHLDKCGIGTAVHYPVPLHLHPAFLECGLKAGDLPESEQACQQVLTLPLWPYMDDSIVTQVAERIWQFYAGHAR